MKSTATDRNVRQVAGKSPRLAKPARHGAPRIYLYPARGRPSYTRQHQGQKRRKGVSVPHVYRQIRLMAVL
jgi:hypothetical protein